MRGRGLRAGVAIGLVVLASSGVAQAAYAPDRLTAKRLAQPVPPLLSCAALPFKPAALKGPRGYERGTSPAARALATFLAGDKRAVRLPRSGWIAVARRSNRIEFLAGPPNPYRWLEFRRNAGTWEFSQSDICYPRVAGLGAEASGWYLDAGFPKPGPSATRIHALVYPDFCSSGSDSRGRVRRPWVHYGRKTVSVLFYVRPFPGVSTCPSHPLTPVLMRLNEPLGKRQLRDLSEWPRTRPVPSSR